MSKITFAILAIMIALFASGVVVSAGYEEASTNGIVKSEYQRGEPSLPKQPIIFDVPDHQRGEPSLPRGIN